ncbi:hypothetical protein NA57DRAFT_65300 [Rhizodiscina lignyota]|uniref:Zn(2)-C6 fungal-type domain-containing protein n=1 Tax=Rhizodiscina lignyota TaxID=1504668 RepID=A0A9P4IKM1_9PEZI|nr:hypothetical protein NA57DRAFT_65300 [Rhizodiscina lignyota]
MPTRRRASMNALSPSSGKNADSDEQDNWSGADSNTADALDGEPAEEGEDGTSKKRKIRPLSVSCELCKTRKVKCDRGQPACGWCVRNNQVCEYKERKKPGLRAGYGRELESRLDRLEDILRQQQDTIASLANLQQGVQQAPQEGPMFRSPPQLQTPHIPRPETALFIQKPSTYPQSGSQFGDYRQTQHAPPTYQHHITSEPVQHPNQSTLPPTSRDLYSQPNPTLESPNFPPYDLLYALCDIYFKHVNTWCPILHRRSTLDSLFGHTPLQEDDRILLHAIVATTLRFSGDPRLTEEAREKYHEVSKQKVLLYGLENSSVKALQAMVILALDLVGASNGPPGWNLLALITRSVVQLGLAVEATSSSVAPSYASIYTLRAITLPEPKDWIEEESRRRLFWMVYLLDRYATVSTAFDFALSDHEIDRKLPCRDDLFSRNQPVETRWFRTSERDDYSIDKPENLGSFSYYIEVIGILSKIHQFLKKPVDIGALSDVEQWQREYRELDNMLSTWKYNLPAEYSNMSRVLNPGSGNKIVNCGWVMLHAAYNTTIIRLHSSAGYPTTRSPIFTPSYAASQRCMAAVEAMVDLVNFVRSPGTGNGTNQSQKSTEAPSNAPKDNMVNKLGPPFAFCVWVAARMVLVHGSTVDRHVSPGIYPLLDTLRDMGRYWKVAERYASLLTRVLDEYESSDRGRRDGGLSAPTADGGRPGTPTAVKILADMRRTAFDLDFLISRQPHAQHSAVRNGYTPSRDNAPGNAAGNGATPSGMDTLSAAASAAVRQPQQNELEYLDVFDFFNMPRLPVGFEGVGGNGGYSSAESAQNGAASGGQAVGGTANNEFNITNYMVDASSDWFVKTPS